MELIIEVVLEPEDNFFVIAKALQLRVTAGKRDVGPRYLKKRSQKFFAQAAQFTIGTASRNPVVGPGYQALDVMLGKTFAVNESVRAEFRAEAFNVTNTPSLGPPNTSFGTAAFGTITRAFDPRVFEFAVKVHF